MFLLVILTFCFQEPEYVEVTREGQRQVHHREGGASVAGGRGLGHSAGGSSQVVSVRNNGTNGGGKQLVSRKVSYKVDIYYSLISFFIVGIAYETGCHFVTLIAVLDVGRNFSCYYGRDRGAEGAGKDIVEEKR